MSSKGLLQISKCVTRDAKRSRLDVVWKRVKSNPRSVRVLVDEIWWRLLVRVEEDLCELLVSKHLPKDHASVECDLFIGISSERSKDDLLVSRTNILDGG